jgi:hypothetical protein
MEEILRKHKLPNGREVDIIHLTFGRARICLVDEACDLTYEDSW